MRKFLSLFLALCTFVIAFAVASPVFSSQKAKAGFCTDQGVPCKTDAITDYSISFAQNTQQIINTDHYLPFPNEGNKVCQESTVICTCEDRFMLTIKDWSWNINPGYSLVSGKINKHLLSATGIVRNNLHVRYDPGWQRC